MLMRSCPVSVGVICAAPSVEGAWWRAQVITFYKETNEVEIRYVDYGGYDRVKIDTLRQIRYVYARAKYIEITECINLKLTDLLIGAMGKDGLKS